MTRPVAGSAGSRLEGWPVLGWVMLALLALCAATLLAAPPVDGVRMVIRLTARCSLALFLLAFTASASAARWPGRATRWLLRHRRQAGLGFAFSHALHLAAIVAYARLDPAGFARMTSPANLVTGGLAYAFIVALAATSSDAAVAWMGARAWKRLHAAGVWYLWVSFVIAFGKRIPLSPGYAAPVALLLLALALRAWRAPRPAGVS